MKETLVSETLFPCKHFTTTKTCGDMKDEAQRNTLLHSLGVDRRRLVLAKQVHGNNVRAVSEQDGGCFIEDCDGLITSGESVPLGIFTADCMPVLMLSDDKSVKAAVHAGWRGLACGIIQNAVNIFREEFDVAPENITAYIGPHIRECCYEVSPELEKVFGIMLKNGKLSLSSAAAGILKNSGVKKLYASAHCSCCESEKFFSYRKDKTGRRMITVIY